jgi:hypothetical protein
MNDMDKSTKGHATDGAKHVERMGMVYTELLRPLGRFC